MVWAGGIFSAVGLSPFVPKWKLRSICTGFCRFKVPVPIGWPEYSHIGNAIIIPVTNYRNISCRAEMERPVYITGFCRFKVPVPAGWPEYSHIGYAVVIPVTNYRNISGRAEMEASCLHYRFWPFQGTSSRWMAGILPHRICRRYSSHQLPEYLRSCRNGTSGPRYRFWPFQGTSSRWMAGILPHRKYRRYSSHQLPEYLRSYRNGTSCLHTGFGRFKVPVPAGWPKYSHIGNAVVIPVTNYRNISCRTEMHGDIIFSGIIVIQIPVSH